MFSRLTYEDKVAFFELLDEYFESRPHLLSQAQNPDNINNAAASQPASMAANAAHRAMASNPQATANLISSGLKTIPKNSQYGAASNPMIANAAGRFAASSLTSSYNSGSPSQAKSPPAPPKRNFGTSEESPSPGRPSPSGGIGSLGGLMSSKRFGDLDTSSVKNAITSSFKGGKPAVPPPSTTLPPAMAPRRDFAPPPVRRVATNTSHESDAGDADAISPENRQNRLANPDLAPLRRMPSDHALQRRVTPEPESVKGERAEAIYDYNSEAAEDINVRAGDKFIIVERTSDDWWTGEMDGKRGLLPASYVRIL